MEDKNYSGESSTCLSKLRSSNSPAIYIIKSHDPLDGITISEGILLDGCPYSSEPEECSVVLFFLILPSFLHPIALKTPNLERR